MCDSPSSSSSSANSASSGGSGSSSSSGGSSTSDADAHIYGTGSFHNIRRGIELRLIADDFHGLFATEPLPAGTIVWKNREDGPAEERYRKIYGEEIEHLSPAELKFFIRYSYQNDDEFFISPLTAHEVDLDYSNYWNHSCNPNTLPFDEDHWVTIRDVEAGEHLTIDYATFDSNQFICIERCLCGSEQCRRFVRGDDYRIRELQDRYRGHFLPYIQKKMDEESALRLAHPEDKGIVGGAGGPTGDFSAAAVQAWHESHPVDVDAHNRRGLAELMARFAPPSGANGGRAAFYKNKREAASAASAAAAESDATPVPILALPAAVAALALSSPKFAAQACSSDKENDSPSFAADAATPPPTTSHEIIV